MQKTWVIGLTLFCSAISAANAAPGEWWEVTTKMEMPGMPFAMPPTTTKMCIAKGAENDPKQSMQDKECEMTDLKTSGNKTTWKVRCVRDGEVMNGTGENTSTADSYHGTMHLSGKSGGKPMDMTSTYSGKRVGPACDSSQPSPEMAKAQKQIAQSCETSGHSTRELINMADIFLPKDSLCSGKSKALCDAVRKDVGKDAEAYSTLVAHDQNLQIGRISIAKACGLDMAAATKSICKTFDDKNHRMLASHCPAEAKAYRAAMRKKECEGSSYTSQEDLSRCISGSDSGDIGKEDEDAGKSSGKPSSGKSSSGASNPADQVIDGAKKLKGLLGF